MDRLSAAQLLDRARAEGITVTPTPDGSSLLVTGQADSQELVHTIAERKGELLAHLTGSTWPPDSDKEPDAVSYRRITSVELDSGDYQTNYLIGGVLVEGQPCVMAAPHKCLKTTLLVDLALSLSHGLPFLGQFEVPEARRVLVMSGESGLATLQETGRRIARAKGKRLSDFGVVWSPDLPLFASPSHLLALREFLTGDEIDVVCIDPAFLAMPAEIAESASNMFAMGAVLRGVGTVCDQAGATPVVAHHMKRTGANHDPPDLASIAWSGWAEWARQWILLNRREGYDPDSAGEHRLWLAVGGSAGHSGLWGLDVVEGRQSDPGGRRWEVELRPAGEVRGEQRTATERAREERQADRFSADCEFAIRKLEAAGVALTLRQWRDKCGWGDRRLGRVVEHLTDEGAIVSQLVATGNQRTPRTPAYTRAEASQIA